MELWRIKKFRKDFARRNLVPANSRAPYCFRSSWADGGCYASLFRDNGQLWINNQIYWSFFSVPPPLKWRSNFWEALRHYAALKMMINCGKTSADFISGQVSCRKYCPACFYGAEDTGTIIMTMDGCFSFKHCDRNRCSHLEQKCVFWCT